MIRVLLVDDHAAFRQPLTFMLNREPDLTVVGQAGSVTEAMTMLEGVDVAIVDLDLPDGRGTEVVSSLRSVNSRCKVLVLTGSSNQREQSQAVEAGAAGVMHKSARIEEIIDVVRRLDAGEEIMSQGEMIEMLRTASRLRSEDREGRLAIERLTPRECDVLHALSLGMSDKEIALQLHVRTETVRTHMVNILGKLGVESRLQALVFAVRHGAVTIE